MVQSVELLLDDTLDIAVRREWALLADHDLPSQARHSGSSNRPHVTLAVADDVDAVTERRIVAQVAPAFLSIRLGALVVFGGKRFTLARLVVPSMELLAYQHELSALICTAQGFRPHTMPGQWTPHVTLARRLTPEELDEAFRVLPSVLSDSTGAASALRRWDGEAMLEWTVWDQNRKSPN